MMFNPEKRKLALLAREKIRKELDLKKIKRRPHGPEIRKMAFIALFYWEFFREVDWYGNELRKRTSRKY